MFEINGVKFITDNDEAIKYLKSEKLYGVFTVAMSKVPKDKSYIVMSDKNDIRNVYCQYFREVDEFGQKGFSITIIENPMMKMDAVRKIERIVINNFDGEIYKAL